MADTLGLTFQQVQNYERGANRISASKHYEIARTLRVSIAWFFEGLSDPSEGRVEGMAEPEAPFAHNFLITQDGADLASLFPRLQKRQVRRRLVDLVRALVDEEQEQDAGAA